jgi:hypothetical protein
VGRLLAASAIVLVIVACGSSSTTAPSAAPSTTAAAAATTAPPTAAPSTAKPATPAPTLATTFDEGRYTGTWTNTTFGSTGSAAIDVKFDRTAFTAAITLTLGGNVFGAPAPAPETFTFPITPSGVSSTVKSKTFGDFTVTLNAGKATFKGDNVSARVKTFEGTGTYAAGVITINYTVTLSDGSKAQGVVNLKKA